MFLFRGGGISFEPKADIPPLSGKIILVTGATSGLGKQSVLEFARHRPAQLWVAARTVEKANATIDEIKKEVPDAELRPLELDLESFDSVRSAARIFRDGSGGRLDILMLNAGIMNAPAGLTSSGYELQFGTNHVGHALLTKLLLPTLLQTAKEPGADVRVIVLSSAGVYFAPKDGIQFGKLKTPCEDVRTWTRYGQSKLSNALYARQLAKRYPQLTVASIHPGAVNTNLGRFLLDSFPWLEYLAPILAPMFNGPDIGAKNQLWASVSSEVASGEFYYPIGVTGKGGQQVNDEELAKKLWDWTEEELKLEDI